MGKIKQLSLHEAQKIAAGEVVERPANVVKELIENSIDAGATSIAIYLENAGQDLIRIVDDGCGMSLEDAQKCFDHHATSKINCVDDVPFVTSFGFRGEALASIAAVSYVTLITKQEEEQVGIQITRDPQHIQKIEEVAATRGTDIFVRDLFFNVPVRKKFLKSPETELRQITQLFQAFCFDYPAIHFLLFSEEKQIYNCTPVHNSTQRIAQIWPIEQAQQMIPFSCENNYASVSGMISNQQLYKYDRFNQFFFVNKRWVKHHQLANALAKGYLNTLPEGRHPLAILNIQVSPQEVDINIHPRKQEVQFLHPKAIEQLIQKGVKQALEQHVATTIKLATTARETITDFPFSHFKQREFIAQPYVPSKNYVTPVIGTHNQENITAVIDAIEFPVPDLQPQQINAQQQLLTMPIVDHNMFDIILRGQLKKTYIIAEDAQGMILIDQHAAHERILYENFRTKFASITSTDLLFPEMLALTPQEYETYNAHKDLFGQYGFTLEQFSEQQIIIRAIPVHCVKNSASQLIKEILFFMHENRHEVQNLDKLLNEHVHAQMACKAAVKAGDILQEEQMRSIITQLYASENKFSCPHGRPTLWHTSFDQIEKNFRRKK